MIFHGLVIAGVVIATRQGRVFLTGIRAAFGKGLSVPWEKLKDAVDLFKLLRKSTMYAGILSCMTGIISLLAHYDMQTIINDRGLTSSISLSLLGIYYALIINLIFIGPVIAVLQKRLKALPGHDRFRRPD
jgi:hypothetical protein